MFKAVKCIVELGRHYVILEDDTGLVPPDPESERPSYLHSFLATACSDVEYDWLFPKHFRLWAPKNKKYDTHCTSDVPGQTARLLPQKHHPRMLMIYPMQCLWLRIKQQRGNTRAHGLRLLSKRVGAEV